MNLTCNDCGHTFQIDKTKIPSSTFNVKCPNCKKVFQVSLAAGAEPSKTVDKSTEELPSKVSSTEQLKGELEVSVKKQLEDVRKEILLSLASLVGHSSNASSVHTQGYSDKHALVCQSDPTVAQQLALVLQRLGYAVQTCSLLVEALGRLESGYFEVIVTDFAFQDDPEGGQKLLGKVNGRKTEERRKMFVVMVSDQIKTLPAQGAFFQGVNISVHKSDLRNFERFFQDGVRHFNEMYGNYYKMLDEATERL